MVPGLALVFRHACKAQASGEGRQAGRHAGQAGRRKAGCRWAGRDACARRAAAINKEEGATMPDISNTAGHHLSLHLAAVPGAGRGAPARGAAWTPLAAAQTASACRAEPRSPRTPWRLDLTQLSPLACMRQRRRGTMGSAATCVGCMAQVQHRMRPGDFQEHSYQVYNACSNGSTKKGALTADTQGAAAGQYLACWIACRIAPHRSHIASSSTHHNAGSTCSTVRAARWATPCPARRCAGAWEG